MQSNFGRAIETHGKDARSRTYRGVAGHVLVLPGASAHPSRQHRLQFDRNRPGQADLASVRMPAQHQIEIGVGSLAINLGCVRQQHRKCTLRDLQRSLFDVVDPIKVRVINSRQIDALIATCDRFTFIEQYLYAHSFHRRNHLNGVVVAEHAKNRLLKLSSHFCHPFQGRLERAYGVVPAILVSGLVWAVFHTNHSYFDTDPLNVVIWFCIFLVVSAMLGTIAHRTNSVLPGIVIHAGFDSTYFISAGLLQPEIAPLTFLESLARPPVFIAAGAMLAVLAALAWAALFRATRSV